MIYLDANVIIRFVEGTQQVRTPIQARLAGVPAVATSQLSRLECRCFPMRQNDVTLLAAYDTFFRAADLSLIDIDARVIDVATRLRGIYGFKSPDAIHLASAVVAGASSFLTGDRQLARCAGVPVEIL